jgi:membrane-associated PAP2 superfamily phosphatase
VLVGRNGLAVVAACLVAATLLFGLSPVDLLLQDHLYDPATRAWVVDSADRALRLVFYRGPKVVLATFGLAMAALALAGLRHPRGSEGRRRARRQAFVFTAMAAIPLAVGAGKRLTGIHCPSEVDRYGGSVPTHGWFEAAPVAAAGLPRGRCFPAAHASGGFALMALAFASQRPRLRWAAPGLVLGWVMGAYQMLRGVHYLSHTVVSMLVAWGLILVIAGWFGLDDGRREGSRRGESRSRTRVQDSD